ncbi:ALG1, chitobiosyldiphosphodolichol beta-mannosyltransferase [Leptinotarsa decemlineata]|uniref:ALG1, chitobiosyldiphosphodolichol beta-mannosyltransferase n=1 Tax=Leptinotarsa decemlineata TaxID=7539 RepID=UPI000C253DB8|nr:chitobiosyldiphosphodolichol beta-mannosyltransferase [Leptinotarsa decemlineata]
MACKSKNICIVVLGDIGRSPRMQYHSLSLADLGHKVDILGYGETDPLDEVKKSPLLYYHYLLACPTIPHKLTNYAFKTIWQILNLLFLLVTIRKPDIILVQNPPAIPALLVCWVFSKVVGSKLYIDWHNYAHSIMALNLSKDNMLVKITKRVEMFVGRKADHNFCVTNAMKKDLCENWNISAVTLYDKPPKIFRSISLEEKDIFLKRLGKRYNQIISRDGSTVFTENTNDGVRLKPSRPGLLVSSTSWTEDEDFSILFSALQEYEDHIENGNQRKLAQLICFITGKGHLKEYYCSKIAKQNWKNVCVITPWLESNDYPLMLASADLGVCLHTSSSGLDLPMKVVDMFGCGLPVCAYDFECLDELVHHGINGYKFKSSRDLAEQLQNWFEYFPNSQIQQATEKKFKAELHTFQMLRWQENWTKIASETFA